MQHFFFGWVNGGNAEDALERAAGAGGRGGPGQQRRLPVRGVGRGAGLLVGQRRRPHGRRLPAAPPADHQRRPQPLPARRRRRRQLHVGPVAARRQDPLVHQRQKGRLASAISETKPTDNESKVCTEDWLNWLSVSQYRSPTGHHDTMVGSIECRSKTDDHKRTSDNQKKTIQSK